MYVKLILQTKKDQMNPWYEIKIWAAMTSSARANPNSSSRLNVILAFQTKKKREIKNSVFFFRNVSI